MDEGSSRRLSHSLKVLIRSKIVLFKRKNRNNFADVSAAVLLDWASPISVHALQIKLKRQTWTFEYLTQYALSSTNTKETLMSKELHEKAAEQHEQAAKAHRAAAQQHGSNDIVSAKQQSGQAFEKSKAAHEQSTKAHNTSQQQQR